MHVITEVYLGTYIYDERNSKKYKKMVTKQSRQYKNYKIIYFVFDQTVPFTNELSLDLKPHISD